MADNARQTESSSDDRTATRALGAEQRRNENTLETSSTSSRELPPPKKTKKNRPKRKWKKPEGMPKRPLSAYNFFFADERRKIIERNELERNLSGQPLEKVGFAGLAIEVANKWKTLDPHTKEIYQHKYKTDRARYQIELRLWERQMSTIRKKRLAEDASLSTMLSPSHEEETGAKHFYSSGWQAHHPQQPNPSISFNDTSEPCHQHDSFAGDSIPLFDPASRSRRSPPHDVAVETGPSVNEFPNLAGSTRKDEQPGALFQELCAKLEEELVHDIAHRRQVSYNVLHQGELATVGAPSMDFRRASYPPMSSSSSLSTFDSVDFEPIPVFPGRDIRQETERSVHFCEAASFRCLLSSLDDDEIHLLRNFRFSDK